ncbi:hypothetical protein [Candidatus Amarolinea dominans]
MMVASLAPSSLLPMRRQYMQAAELSGDLLKIGQGATSMLM